MFLKYNGSAFQRVGATTEKLFRPCFDLVFGTSSKNITQERKFRLGLYSLARSHT